MTTRKAFQVRGTVEAVLIGLRSSYPFSTIVPKIQVTHRDGVKDDYHSGTRLIDVRERELLQHKLMKGGEIANHRHFSAVSVEELAEIQAALSIPAPIPYGCLYENLVISGIPRLTQLPTGTLLLFEKSDGTPRTAALVVWKENMPCDVPAKALQSRFPNVENVAKHFQKASLKRRGIVGSVYSSGFIHEGDRVIACIPEQTIYEPPTV